MTPAFSDNESNPSYVNCALLILVTWEMSYVVQIHQDKLQQKHWENDTHFSLTCSMCISKSKELMSEPYNPMRRRKCSFISISAVIPIFQQPPLPSSIENIVAFLNESIHFHFGNMVDSLIVPEFHFQKSNQNRNKPFFLRRRLVLPISLAQVQCFSWLVSYWSLPYSTWWTVDWLNFWWRRLDSMF